MISKDFTLDTFKRKCSKISDFLKSKGHNVPISTLHHALSLMLDENNWNTLKAKLETKHEIYLNKKEEKENVLLWASFIKDIYDYFFGDFFKIYDEEEFLKELILIAEEIEKNEDVHFLYRTMPNFNFIKYGNFRDYNLIGDEDVLKISILDKAENEYELAFITKIILLMTTPGKIKSSELNECLSRNPVLFERNNGVKNKNYIYIFFDENELLNKIEEKQKERYLSMGASSSSLNNEGRMSPTIKKEENVKKLNLLDKTTKIQIDYISFKDNTDDIKKVVRMHVE